MLRRSDLDTSTKEKPMTFETWLCLCDYWYVFSFFLSDLHVAGYRAHARPPLKNTPHFPPNMSCFKMPFGARSKPLVSFLICFLLPFLLQVLYLYSWDHSGVFFSAKAVIPIFWSFEPKREWKILLSYLTPSASDDSWLWFTTSFAAFTARRP